MVLCNKVDDIMCEIPASKSVMYEMDVYCMNLIEVSFHWKSRRMK